MLKQVTCRLEKSIKLHVKNRAFRAFVLNYQVNIISLHVLLLLYRSGHFLGLSLIHVHGLSKLFYCSSVKELVHVKFHANFAKGINSTS